MAFTLLLSAMRWKGKAGESGKGLEELHSVTQCPGPGFQGAKRSHPTYSPRGHQASERQRKQCHPTQFTPPRRSESSKVCLAQSVPPSKAERHQPPWCQEALFKTWEGWRIRQESQNAAPLSICMRWIWIVINLYEKYFSLARVNEEHCVCMLSSLTSSQKNEHQ